MLTRVGSGAALAVLVMTQAATAADKPATAPIVARLAACRALTDDGARLACFDREAADFDTAVRDRKIAVIDQAEIRKTRRTLFGIPLPSIKLFDSDDEPALKQVTATIRSTQKGEGGRIVFTLDDGAVWAQTDDWPVFSAVRPGQKVTLKRAALGSYFADFEKTVSVRAKRLR